MEDATIDFLINAIGTLGVAFILVTYFLLQSGKIKSNQLSYSVLNLIGSSLILASLFKFWNLPSVIVEAFWVLISIYGIYKYRKAKG
ncbi:MAG: hypothetical protein K0R98_107 [Rickettsiaceae bacterium]|jgi:hypothetical protein|nr:hypothetical protein [Rickettsiaceae bacterium]